MGLLAMLVAATVAPAAFAQGAMGLRSDFRILNSMLCGSNNGEVRETSPWVTVGPLVVNLQNSVTSTCYSNTSSSSFTVSADYGELSVAGTGAATAEVGVTGSMLALGTVVGGDQNAVYTDRLYVSSTTLPIGTPATVQVQLLLTGYFDILDANPSVGYATEVRASYGSTTLLDLLLGTTGSSVGTFATTVGDSAQLTGSLTVGFSANGVAAAVDGSSSVDANLVARTFVTSLTPGATVSFNVPTAGVPVSPRPFEFALAGARPNPSPAGRMTLQFSLPSSAPASLALYDVGGRLVASADVGSMGPGGHSVDLSQGRKLAPGVYLARLTQGALVRTARVAVLP